MKWMISEGRRRRQFDNFSKWTTPLLWESCSHPPFKTITSISIASREASNLESEVKGLHENMKTVLEDNLQLKSEVLRWRSQRESERAKIDLKTRTVENRQMEELELQLTQCKEEAAAYAKQLEEKDEQLEQREKELIAGKSETLRLQSERDRWEAEAEDLRIGSKTLQQVKE